jgi:subfamily B ATP-binding cassette protein MsbA
MMAYLSIRHSEGSVSAYLVFFALVRRAMTSLGTITSFQGNVASVIGPLREIVRVFEEREKWLEKKSGGKIASFQSEINFQNLSFEYTDRKILNGVSFSVKKGQMVAIVGRTGSGKSTIAQLLMRFYDPPKGSVLIDGQDILSLDLQSWRKKIAFISQENYFFDASIGDNLKYGCEVDPNADEMISALEKAQLGELLKKLPSGIVTEIGERGIQLSGGEKQRLSLARTILRDPEILILDEATSALDSQTEKLVQSAIDQVVRGRTSIVIAHRLSTIKNADKIILLDGGKVVEQGSFNELIVLGNRFKSFWDVQQNMN